MSVAVLGIDWQTLADAVGLGGIYALMAVGIGLVLARRATLTTHLPQGPFLYGGTLIAVVLMVMLL